MVSVLYLFKAEINNIFQAPIPSVPPALQNLVSASGHKLEGKWALIEIKTEHQKDFLRIPACLKEVTDHLERRMLMGSLGFLSNHNLVLIPALNDHSILYNDKEF